MKSSIITTSCLTAIITIIIGLNTYLDPILTARGNIMFNESTSSLFASVVSSENYSPSKATATPPLIAGTPFAENFSKKYTVTETGSLRSSRSSDWWLSSGAYHYSLNGIGSTITGSLPAMDPWRIAFALSNSIDTDNGYHPQNIFRLVLKKSKWQNLKQEAYFEIIKDNLSDSPNRNESNGFLFFNRYQDSFNLYYTGIRVDGMAVIKKKIGGTYYTLALKSVFNNSVPYSRDVNPNVIPQKKWIGLRSEVITGPNNTVKIKLSIDKDKTGNWVLAAEATDDGRSYGGPAILNKGYAGIRTDFMDIQFDDYKIISL